jgi:hypothetical protein
VGRAATVAVLALLALGGAPAHAASPRRTEPAAPLALKPAIPPQLAELEAKADALQITSARVSISTSLRLGHASKGVRELARLFAIKITGVETVSPPAAALTLKLFGADVRLRYVEGHAYVFSWGLGLHDGGRPWVELGHGLLGQAYGGVGKKPDVTPATGAARYGKLFTLVNDGIGIHELAPTTLYGQSVTGFQEELEPKAGLEAGSSGGAIGGLAARRPLPAPPKPKLTVYFAAGGAPVRVQMETGDGHTGLILTADFPAIDFPYTIPAPPPSHVISEREALKRFPPRHSSQSFGIQGASESSQSVSTTTGPRK